MKSFLSTILCLLLSVSVSTQTITVGSTNLQTWKGWESQFNDGLGDFLTTGQNWHDAVLDTWVGLGGNRIRTEISSGMMENTTDYYAPFYADGRDSSTNPYYSDLTNNAIRYTPINDNADPNSINSSGFKFTWMTWQVDNYILPLQTKLAARGESLFWVVCFVHFSTSNQLHIDTPAEYGELILATWQYLNTTYGQVPNGLEIMLEGNNPAANVTGAEIAAMIIAARDRLVAAGFAKPYIVAPTSVNSLDITAYYESVKTANATAAGYIDEVSRHRYGPAPDDTYLTTLRSTLETDGKKSSQLETDFLGTLQNLHQDIEVGRVSAWNGAWLMSYPDVADGGYVYLLANPSSPWNITKTSRAKYAEHYIKYIRQNAVMKSVTNSSSNFKGLPFRNANGKYVMPVLAATSGTVTVSGLPPGTYGRRRTQGDGTAAPSSYDTDLGNATVTTNEDVTLTFTAAGVGTIYDTNYLQSSTMKGTIKGAITIRGNVKW